ncbi:MAG: SLBB domain-containing protein [Verrucomicrobia bacterium]|nr:SLBB domain-containing protein [Verrucomicrobiota bacterium]
MKTFFALFALGIIATGCTQVGPKFDPYAPAHVGEGVGEVDTLDLTAMPNRMDPRLLESPTTPFTLGPGDRLEIEILDEGADPAETRALVPVGPDGKIYYSLLPGMDVWGLTVTQTKELIEQEFSKFLREKPQIGITVRSVESKKIWVLGRVQAPGVFPMSGATTLLEALSLAGGTQSHSGNLDPNQILPGEEIADLRRAFIVRKGELLPVNFQSLLTQGDISQNIYLQPDDFIYFPAAAAREVYVLGAVNQPRAVPYQEGMTLVGAIANVAGTYKEAYDQQVAIVRGSVSQPQIAIVNYKQIAKGQAKDVALEPGDIIHVPLEPYRHLRRYADLILNTFVTSVAINEGTRSVSRVAAPTGVVIPLGSSITVTPPITVPAR